MDLTLTARRMAGTAADIDRHLALIPRYADRMNEEAAAVARTQADPADPVGSLAAQGRAAVAVARAAEASGDLLTATHAVRTAARYERAARIAAGVPC